MYSINKLIRVATIIVAITFLHACVSVNPDIVKWEQQRKVMQSEADAEAAYLKDPVVKKMFSLGMNKYRAFGYAEYVGIKNDENTGFTNKYYKYLKELGYTVKTLEIANSSVDFAGRDISASDGTLSYEAKAIELKIIDSSRTDKIAQNAKKYAETYRKEEAEYKEEQAEIYKKEQVRKKLAEIEQAEIYKKEQVRRKLAEIENAKREKEAKQNEQRAKKQMERRSETLIQNSFSKNTNFLLGDRVCSKDNKVGFVDNVGTKNIKILVKEQTFDIEQDYYWFKFHGDTKVNLISEMIWDKKENWGKCLVL